MIRQNLHTHSVFCDGKDTVEEMIQTAIEKKFNILGFSGHGPCSVDLEAAMNKEELKAYIQEVNRCKEKYKDQISIHLGIEEDIFERLSDITPYEYIIGSKHFITHNGITLPIDYSKDVSLEIMDLFGNDFNAFSKNYYADYALMKDYEEVDIVGHLDLLTKYNEDESFGSFTDPVYVKSACDCIDALNSTGKIFEMNTGAIARGYRKTPYPYKNLLEYMASQNAKLCLNSDCHNRDYLDCGFDLSLEWAKNCGFKELMIFTENGFKPISIDEIK